MVVWAGMTSEGKTLFVFVDKNARINSDVYQNVILDAGLYANTWIKVDNRIL